MDATKCRICGGNIKLENGSWRHLNVGVYQHLARPEPHIISTDYPLFIEIAKEMEARPNDTIAILQEYIAPLVNVCGEINEWCRGIEEPPWYWEFVRNLARFDVDLSPIWKM